MRDALCAVKRTFLRIEGVSNLNLVGRERVRISTDGVLIAPRPLSLKERVKREANERRKREIQTESEGHPSANAREDEERRIKLDGHRAGWPDSK